MPNVPNIISSIPPASDTQDPREMRG